nr:hypothetical protein [Tanacetum cinerariifolium]
MFEIRFSVINDMIWCLFVYGDDERSVLGVTCGVDGKNGGHPLNFILKKSGYMSAANVNEEVTVTLNKGTCMNTTVGGVAQPYVDVNTKIMDESPSTVQRHVTMTHVVMVHNFQTDESQLEVDYVACTTESDGKEGLTANDGQHKYVAAVMDSNDVGANGTNTRANSMRSVEIKGVVQ